MKLLYILFALSFASLAMTEMTGIDKGYGCDTSNWSCWKRVGPTKYLIHLHIYDFILSLYSLLDCV